MFSFFLVAIAVTAWFGGFGPALCAIILSLLLATYFFLPPDSSIAVRFEDVPDLVIFLTTALLLSGLHQAVRHAEERKEMLLARKNAELAELHAASVAKDVLLGMVSHELRNPLAAISAWARVLACEKPERSAAFSTAVEAIERNTRLQARIVEDLLDISRAVSGKLCLNLGPTDLVPVIHASLDLMRLPAEEKHIHLREVTEPGVGLVTADPDRMQQVVCNLVGNAVKFTPEGGTVEVRLGRIDSKVQITVSDTGPGIPPEFLPRMFEPFTQADTMAARRAGLGLGLAIARQLVELHNGTIQACNRQNSSGAAFTVLLPNA